MDENQRNDTLMKENNVVRADNRYPSIRTRLYRHSWPNSANSNSYATRNIILPNLFFNLKEEREEKKKKQNAKVGRNDYLPEEILSAK